MSDIKSPADLTAEEASAQGKRFGTLIVAALKNAGFFDECSRLMQAMKEAPTCGDFLKETMESVVHGLKRGPTGMGNRMKMAHTIRRSSDELEMASLSLAIEKHQCPPATDTEVAQLDSMVVHAANGHRAATMLSEDINEGVREVLGNAIGQQAALRMKEMLAEKMEDCGQEDCEVHGNKKPPKILLN